MTYLKPATSERRFLHGHVFIYYIYIYTYIKLNEEVIFKLILFKHKSIFGFSLELDVTDLPVLISEVQL